MSLRLGESSEATFAVDDRGIIVAWNSAAEKLLGYSAQQAVGAQCHEFMHGFSTSGAPVCSLGCPAVEFCKHGTSARRFEMIVPRPDGVDVCVDVVTVTVYDEDRPIAIHVVNESPMMRHLETMARRVAERIEPKPRAGEPQEPLSETLTAREHAVLKLLAEGMRTEEIAMHLGVSRATVRNHVQNVIAKLGVHSRVEAVVAAMHRGIVQTH